MPRFLSGASVAGDGLQERLRSATFALAGLATAVGLVLVGIAYNQGWPEFVDSPLPEMRVGRVGEAAIVSEPAHQGAAAGPAEAQPGAAPQVAGGSGATRPSGPEASGQHQDVTAPGGVTPPVGAPPPAGGGESPSPSPGSPSPVPAAAPEPPAPAATQPPPVADPGPAPPPAAQPPTVAPPASPPPTVLGPGKSKGKGHEKSHGKPPAAPVVPPPPAPTAPLPESPPPTSAGPGNGNGKAKGHDK